MAFTLLQPSRQYSRPNSNIRMVIRSNSFLDDVAVPHGLLHPSIIARIEQERPDLVDHPKLQHFFEAFHKNGPFNAMEYMANPSTMSILVELMMTTTGVPQPIISKVDDFATPPVVRSMKSFPIFRRRGRIYAVKIWISTSVPRSQTTKWYAINLVVSHVVVRAIFTES